MSADWGSGESVAAVPAAVVRASRSVLQPAGNGSYVALPVVVLLLDLAGFTEVPTTSNSVSDSVQHHTESLGGR